MRTYATKQIRQLLMDNPDGMELKDISSRVDRKEDTVRELLKSMPDTYIDRWIGPVRGQYAAVWCVVVPPPDCPHPRRSK